MSKAETFGFGVPWESLFGYSQALRAGDTVYVSGQLSHDADGTFLGEGDFVLQMGTTFANLDKVLRHFGATRRQVVETTVLVRDLREHFGTLAPYHAEFFGEHRPTSTVTGVSDLALPEQLIEVGAVVRLDLDG
ncbi:RidA family protein [Streptomyces sp. NPDC086010]|uniref:RidA family protein n=1 Tax=Streptomyces sp. NPDC086010 TaxID=3365745 RepID=UPI0037D5CD94